MKVLTRIFILLWASAALVQAEEMSWRAAWDGTLYGYANTISVRDDSVLNPNNALAQLAQRYDTVEGRFNLKLESDTLRLAARPILISQQERNAYGGKQKSEGYLSQWQARWKTSSAFSVLGGREVLNWGAAQFRSPSNPFYFDSGRSNPMRELSGMEVVRAAWSPAVSASVYVARLFGSGHGQSAPDPWAQGWLLKADWRGDESTVGMALAKPARQSVFVGAHAQRTLGDAWLFYAELGSSTRSNALLSSADVNQPFMLEAESSRRTDSLVGATYTFAGGQSLSAEYLRYEHGCDSAQNNAYFARAASAANSFPGGDSVPILAMALRAAPPLLGRDYLHLVWQSSPMDSAGFARLMATHNFTDGSSEWAGYGEYTVNTQLSMFALTMVTSGGAQREFARLFDLVFTAGVKLALP